MVLRRVGPSSPRTISTIISILKNKNKIISIKRKFSMPVINIS
jgi:hypothetical protein